MTLTEHSGERSSRAGLFFLMEFRHIIASPLADLPDSREIFIG